VTGPYKWARSLREQVARSTQGLARVAARHSGDKATWAWVAEHRRALQAGGAVVGGVFLLVAPGWWFVVVAVLLAGYEVALWQAGSLIAGSRLEATADTPLGRSQGDG
jgi:hypothetical protein